MHVVIIVLAIIGGSVAVYGLSLGATFAYMIYKFLKEGDG